MALEELPTAIRQETKIKGIQIEKKEIKPSLFQMIYYIQKILKSPPKKKTVRITNYQKKKITIDKDNNEIKVTYSKGTTLRYPLTEENIDLFYQRLARQYSVADQNVNHVVKNKITLVSVMLMLASLIIGIIIQDASLDAMIIEKITTATFGLLSLNGIIICINEMSKKKQKDKIKLVNDFVTNNQTLKDAISEEKNILDDLSISQTRIIETESATLGECGLDSYEYNVNWVDNLSLASLKQIKQRLLIYQGLKQPVDLEDKTSSKSKTRTRTPDE